MNVAKIHNNNSWPWYITS